MPWPLSQDYNEVIQTPAQCFQDPELRQTEARTNAIGIPMPRSGNFADVYEMAGPGGKRWAVKCFTRQVAGLRERYAAISAYLKQVNLPFMVDFDYLERGIQVKGQWYPILKMDWVEGFGLNQFVKEYADQPQHLEMLCQIWVRLARRLREARMAHCDLQHGNVLLVPGSTATSLAIRLIDYDGMFVPALARSKSGEVGHPAYQHPQRLRDGTYNGEVDRFPNLVIYTALRGLIVGSRYLWNKFDNGDNLLFRQQDFANLPASPLFQELRKLNDPQLLFLLDRLSRSLHKPLDQTPLLDELAAEGKPSSGTVRRTAHGNAAPVSAVAPTASRPGRAVAIAGSTAQGAARWKSFLWAWATAAVGVAALAVAIVAVLGRPEPDRATTQVAGLVASGEGTRAQPPEPTRPARRPTTEPRSEVKTEPRTEPKVEPKTGPKPEPSVPAKTEPEPAPQPSPPTEPKTEPKPPPKAEALGPVRTSSRSISPLQTPLQNVAFSADGRRALCNHGTSMIICDGQTGQALRSVTIARDGIPCGLLLPDGRSVFYHLAATLVVFDLYAAQTLRQLPSHASVVQCLVISADGRRAVSGAGMKVPQGDAPAEQFQDCTARLWDLDKAIELRRFTGHAQPVRQVALSPDGRRVVSASADLICLWDAESGKEIRRLGPLPTATALAFHPDGRQLLVAASDHSVRLWDVDGNRAVRTMGRQPTPVQSVAVSPDGTYAVGGGGRVAERDGQRVPEDCVVRLWELASGKELRRFEGHTDTVRSVALSPDSRRLLSGGDSTARLWTVDVELIAAKPLDPVPVPPPAVVQPPVVAQPPPPPPVDGRAPVPSAEARQKALKVVRDHFKQDYARITRTVDRAALAGKLIQKAITTNDDPGARFVLFSETRDLAAQAGDIAAAMTAIEYLEEEFAIDGIDMRLKALTTAGKTAVTGLANKALAESCLAAADDALAADDFRGALGLLALAEPAAKKSRVGSLPGRVQARATDAREAQQEYEQAKAATDTLRQKPSDADANLVSGSYLCFRKGEWARGLPQLAAGSDPVLQGLARKELSKPAEGPAQIDLGDGWWDLGATRTGLVKARIQQRAAFWYQQALAPTTGLTRDRIQTRMKQAEQFALPGQPVIVTKEQRTFTGHAGGISTLVLSPDGKQVLSGSTDCTLRIWDVQSGNQVFDVRMHGEVRAAAWAADGTRAFAYSGPLLNSVDFSRRIGALGLNVGLSEINALACLPNSGRLLAVGQTGRIFLVGYAIPPRIETHESGASGVIHAMAVSADGGRCLLACADGSVRLCEVETGREVRQLLGHRGAVLGVAWTRDGNQATTAGADGTVRAWDVKSGKSLRTLTGHQGRVACIALSPDGRRAVSGGDDNTLRLWDVKTGRELRRFSGHADAITGLAILPDGRQILSASADKTIRLWDPGR